jgi:hypothetical protein
MWLFEEDDDTMEEDPQAGRIKTEGDVPKPESFTKNKESHSEVHWITCSLVKPVKHQCSGFFAEYATERSSKPDRRCPRSLCQEEESAYPIEEKTDSDEEQAEGPKNAEIKLIGPPLRDDVREIAPDSPRNQNRKQRCPNEKHFNRFLKSYVVDGTAVTLFRCSACETVRYIVTWLA